MENEKIVVEQKCKNCGGTLRFDPEAGKLICDYCHTEEIIGEGATALESEFTGFDFNSLNGSVTDESAENLPVYLCNSCGAEVIAPPEQAALTCPYCGNNIVLTDKISGKLRPNGIVPFKISAKDLPAHMNEFYKKKKLLPKNFFSESKMSRITGVYLPYWVFDGTLSGTLVYNAQKSRSHRSGDYIITDTDYYRLYRDVSVSFKDLPVDASKRVENDLTESIEPYDLKEEKPFDMRYLAGFTADRFDIPSEDIAPRAIERMRNTAERLAKSEASRNYGTATQSGGSLAANIKARYLLLPMYLFDIRYKEKDYRFAVNGQSGKVVGELPKDHKIRFMYFLKRTLIVAGIIFGFILIKYLVRG